MPTQYADLDELVLQCRSESARHHIREAVLCYRAGAFRAAIVSTWVAVVYDFVDKFRELDLDGDTQAAALVAKFEAIHKADDVQQALEFERTLLTVCKDAFDLLTPQEFVDLERLQKDRNRCAHPNLVRPGEIYLPTPELARAHLRNAVEHALQRPPKVGKAAAQQLFKEVQSEYFPVDPAQAIEVLKRGPLARPKENLLREFLMGITSTALKGDKTIPEVVRRFAAIKATSELHREQFLKLVTTHFPAVLNKTPDAGLKYLLPLITKVPELQPALDAGLRAKLLRCVETAPNDDLPLVLTAALNLGEFKPAATARVSNLDEEAITTYMKSRRTRVPAEIIDRALVHYAEAGNFATANTKAQNIIIPAISSLSREHALRLFEIAAENDQVRQSTEFRGIIRQVRDLNILQPGEFDQQITTRGWQRDFGGLLHPAPDPTPGPTAPPTTT